MDKLKNLAEKMKNAARHGTVQKQLSKGLTLTLRHLKAGDIWVLSLKEEEICRAAFGIPQAAQRETATKGPYHITRFTWLEPAAVQAELLPGIKPISRYYEA
jgi:hypothetical protein